MTEYRLVAGPRADLDVAATFDWYENERAGLGREFLDELRATYDRVADGPLGYSICGREPAERCCGVSPTPCTSLPRPM